MLGTRNIRSDLQEPFCFEIVFVGLRICEEKYFGGVRKIRDFLGKRIYFEEKGVLGEVEKGFIFFFFF